MNKQVLRDLALSLGAESADEVNMVGEDEQVLESDTGSAQTIEMVEEDSATEDIINEAEEMSGDIDAVDELTAAVEHFQANGDKLSRVEAAALKLTFNQIGRKHYQGDAANLPATESSAGMTSNDLTLAHESLKETAGDFIKKIIEIIKGLISKVVNFIQRLVNRTKWLKRRLGGIQNAVSQKVEWPEGPIQIPPKGLTTNGKASKESIIEHLNENLVLQLMSNPTSNTEWIDDLMGGFSTPTPKRVVSDGEASTFTKVFSDINTKVIKDFRDASDKYPTIKGGSAGLPEDVVEGVVIPGEFYVGYTRIGENGPFCPVCGKIAGTDKDESANQVTIQLPTKQEATDIVDKALSSVLTTVKWTSRTGREWQNNKSFMDLQKKNGNVDIRQDKTDKEKLKILVKFVKTLTAYEAHISDAMMSFFDGLVNYLEASLKAEILED